MSDQPDKEQRTEEATPRRREKLREEGKVAVSADVGAVAVVLAGSAVLWAMGPWGLGRLSALAVRALRLRDAQHPIRILQQLGLSMLLLLLPVLLASAVAASLAGAVQTRGLFRLDLVAPKPERLDPLPRLKRLLPGKESAAEIGKQALKLLGVLSVVGWVLHAQWPMLLGLAAVDVRLGAAAVAALAGKVLFAGLAAFALSALLDYLHARHRFAVEARMTRKELRDEHKEQEGDPQLKGARRRRARELASRRAVADVRRATVLVTNPTHYAVALRYEPEQGDPAPIVVAKGVDTVALRMRDVARRRGVPVVEHRPLARALHRDGKVGRPIPVDLYAAAAEVVAHVMRLRAEGRLPRSRGPGVPRSRRGRRSGRAG